MLLDLLFADRSVRRLVEAALDEFAEKGYTGARVQDIAKRAGLNKQLISHYFGGKEGLYREIQRLRFEREATFSDSSVPFDELAARYLHDALVEPRLMRLILWRGLGTRPEQLTPESRGSADLRGFRERSASVQVMHRRFEQCALESPVPSYLT